jgi:hypothetical protein
MVKVFDLPEHFSFIVYLTKITAMKKIATPVLFLLAFFFLKAQVSRDKISYNKDKQECLVMHYNFPPDAVENALIDKLKKLGYIGREEKGMLNRDKGFRVYKETTIDEISSNKYDYVINIEKKSNKELDETNLYLIIFKGNENGLSQLSRDEFDKVKDFLTNLVPEVEAAHIEILVAAQLATVDKADKKLKTLQEDSVLIQSKIKKLQEELDKNVKDQEAQKKEIETQKQMLDALKGRRKSSA